MIRDCLQRMMLTLGAGVCHQLPSRSFISGGFQQPVCARCSGIYLGVIFGLVALLFLYRYRRPQTATYDDRLQAQLHRSYWVFLVLALGVMAFDGFSSYLHLRPTTNTLRLITGLAVGGGLAPLLLALLSETLLSRRATPKMLARTRDWIVYLSVLITAGIIDALLARFLGPVVPLLVAGCLVATYTTLALIVLGLIPRFEHRIDSLRDAGAPGLIAVALALLLLLGFALMRAVLLSWLVR